MILLLLRLPSSWSRWRARACRWMTAFCFSHCCGHCAMPHSTCASLAAFTTIATRSAASFPATCVSPTPSDRKASAMFRKRQRDWRSDEDHESLAAEYAEEREEEELSPRAATRASLRSYSLMHAAAHPYSPIPSASMQRQRRRRVGDDDRSSWKPADHVHVSEEIERLDYMEDRHPYHHQDSEDEDHHQLQTMDLGEPSPFKEIQSRVDQVGQQVALAQRNVAELRAMLRHAITSRRKAIVTRGAMPTSRKARVRIDMLCS